MTLTHCSNSLHRYKRGFGVAPILYMLGLIGVVGGTLFSNNMQVLKSNITVQNSLTTRSDLQAATSTLSAEAVLGTDNQTLCPPRSTHLINGDICASAPVALSQFTDFTNVQYLPSGYANAASSGSPVEVGVFAAGAGLKQLDPYGHAYIYCRWENTRNIPASPAFVLLSAGPDGILQTKCGDSTVQGDDALTLLAVGASINRAAVWQADTSNDVSYGATGSKVTIDSNGDLTAAGTVTGNSGLFSALHVTGTSQQDGAATFGGLLTAGTSSLGVVSMTGITDTGSATITGQLGIGVSNPAQALDVQGNIAIRNGGMFMGGGQNQPIYTSSSDYYAGLGFSNATGNGTASTQLFTNNLPRLTVLSNGNVGVGSTSPTYTFDVAGTIQTRAPQTGIHMLSSINNFSSDIYQAPNGLYIVENSNAPINLTSYVSQPILFSINNAERMRLASSGFLGIGTSIPAYPLDVSGAGNISGNLTVGGNLAVTGTTALSNSLTGTNAVFSGNVTATSFTGAMSIGSGGVSFSGALPIANGGTGASNATSALTNLGITSSGYLAIPLPATGVTAGACAAPTVATDGRVTGCGGATAAAAGSAGQIQFNSSGNLGASGSLYWDNTNNRLGIGTASPNSTLTVNGTATVSGAVSMNGAFNVNGAAIFNNLVGIGTNNPQAPLDLYASSGSYAYLRDSQSGLKIVAGGGGNYIESAGAGMSGSAPFSITNMNGAQTWLGFNQYGVANIPAGLGIGTTSPAVTLDVNGREHIALSLTVGVPNTGNSGIALGGNSAALWNAASYYAIDLGTSGLTYAFGSRNGVGFSLSDETVGVIRFVISPTGSVGIGSTAPAATLDVTGFMKLGKYSSQPAVCAANTDGSIAITHIYTLCVCKNGTGWVTASTGSTSCTW